MGFDTHTLPLYMLTGLSCFFLGAVFQQDVSFRGIIKQMQLDPYVFQCRHRIFAALTLFGGNPPKKLKRKRDTSHSILAARWLRQKYCNLCSFFLSDTEISTNEKLHTKIVDTAPLTDIMKYGFPGLDDIHVHKDFVLSYDRRNRIPHWVCEHLCCQCAGDNLHSKLQSSSFSQKSQNYNASTSAKNCSIKSNYLQSHSSTDYDHLAAAFRHHQPMRDRRLLNNALQMNKGLKSEMWQRLENYVCKLAEEHGSVYVYTGPLYMPKRFDYRSWAVRYHVLGLNTIAVPTHFFKIIIVESHLLKGLPYMEGYVVPNCEIDERCSLRSFLSEIRDIEHFTGLKFYKGFRRSELHELSTN